MHALANPKQWEPIDAPLTNTPGERSPTMLRKVAEQFDVTTNPRYLPNGGMTFCNIFLWDVTRALCCEIPHWVKDPKVKKGRRELSANAILDWLLIIGGGWREVSQEEAGARASEGFPTVAVWRNPRPQKSGHVALLLPSVGGQIRIAQAGRRCLFDAPLSEGFGDAKPVRFFTHE